MVRWTLLAGREWPSEGLSFAWLGVGDLVQDAVDASSDVYQIDVSKGLVKISGGSYSRSRDIVDDNVIAQ